MISKELLDFVLICSKWYMTIFKQNIKSKDTFNEQLWDRQGETALVKQFNLNKNSRYMILIKLDLQGQLKNI